MPDPRQLPEGGAVILAATLADAVTLLYRLPHVAAMVVSCSEPTVADLGLPVVTGIQAEFSAPLVGVLVLVDGTEGVVLIDPDPHELAGYQAERMGLAPRLRFHLGAEHEIARTLDGWTVLVGAVCADMRDIGHAVSVGADAIYLDGTVMDRPGVAHALAASATGKPLVIGRADRLHAATAALLADRFSLTLVVEHDGPRGPSSACETPRREWRIGRHLTGEDAMDQVAGAACVVVDWQSLTARLADGSMARASEYMVTTYLETDGISPASVRHAIGCMATGLLVRPAEVADAKRAIRESHAEECRAAVLATQAAAGP